MSLKSWLMAYALKQFNTPRDIVRFAARFYGGRVALVDRRGTMTYRQLARRSLQVNNAMQALGVNKGDIVFSWLPETGEQVELRWATFENGAIMAMFHQHLSGEATLQALSSLRPKLFVHDLSLSAGIIERVRSQFPALRMVALGREYEQWLANQPTRRCSTELAPGDLASLHLTSGTTGQPKAVGVTGGKYLTQLRMMAGDLGPAAGAQKDSGRQVLMVGLPLTGPGGGFVLPAMLAGATLVVPESYTASRLAELIHSWHVNRAFLSPSSLIDLLDDPNRNHYDLSSLQNVIYGSEMMSAAKLAEAVQWLGPIFQQGYGSFEAMPPLTWLRPADHVDERGTPASLEVLSSVGVVATGVQIQVMGDDNRPVQDGDTGSIFVKTPLAFSGYWGRPELDDATLHDGWVITGDMGYFDTHHRLHVIGRKADTVTRRGQQIYPRQVEEVAHEHAAVREACLVEINDQAWLVVTLRHGWRHRCDDATMVQIIQDHLDQNLAIERHPDHIHIADNIPRSFLNKMLRREVRASLLQASSTRAQPLARGRGSMEATYEQHWVA